MHDDADYFDAAADRLMNRALVAMVAVQCTVLLIVFSVVAVPLYVLLILLALLVAGNFANAYVLVFFWKPLQQRWPRQALGEAPVMRAFQTFWLGPLARFNFCLHVAVDERFMHITPMLPMRVLGARTISLPFDAVHDVKPSLIPLMMQAKINGRRIAGPSWCLALAIPDEQSSP